MGLVVSAPAVVFLSTPDAAYNTTSPGSGRGWEFQGSWGNFLGTAIAPNYFITAKHVGGTLSGKFHYQGTDYSVLSYLDSPDAGLRVWQVSGTFSSYAALYEGSDEVGSALSVYGRGTQRGAALLNDVDVLAGWLQGTADRAQRWGENAVHSIVDDGAGVGDLLYATFNQGAGVNEAHLTVGDSGGGVFIEEAGEWRLAGINYAVDGYFSRTGIDGTGVRATLFDQGGLFTGKDGDWTYITDQTEDIPSGFYSTRISANQAWIHAAIPEPESYLLVTATMLAGFCAIRRWRLRAGSRLP